MDVLHSKTIKLPEVEGSRGAVRMFSTPELCCFSPATHSCGSIVEQPRSLLISLERLMRKSFVKSLGCWKRDVLVRFVALVRSFGRATRLRGAHTKGIKAQRRSLNSGRGGV